jgi:hypothetical protein
VTVDEQWELLGNGRSLAAERTLVLGLVTSMVASQVTSRLQIQLIK